MLFRFPIMLTVFSCSLSVFAASGLKNVELRDLYFGEVLYHSYQDLHFDALAKLDAELSQYYQVDESELDSLYSHIGQAEYSIGDIELQYRMNQRAGKAIQGVLNDDIDLTTRNMAALQLARLFYKKNDAQSTLYALDLIREDADKSRYEAMYTLGVLRRKEDSTFRADAAYLRAMANMDLGQFSAAVELLRPLQKEQSLQGYIAYNLGIALMQSSREQEGLEVLDRLGQLETGDHGLLALRDKTNLKLAYHYLDEADAKQAKKYFERVRLDGAYSNKALLGAGWMAVSLGRYDRALVPWSVLHEREEFDSSVQETLMAVPYAYGKLGAYGKAANLYSHAMDVFVKEISSLDESIKAIRTGRLLSALLDEKADKDKNWVVNLRQLPETPETRYILQLMASNDFQESYKNYKDLAELRHHIDKWLADLVVYEEMIDIRRAYQQPVFPQVEEQFKKVDARMKLRLEQRDSLATKLKNMLIAPRPEYLATSAEREALQVISALEAKITTDPQSVTEDVKTRMKRLRGIIHWSVHSEYDQRLTDAYNNLIALDKIIKQLNTRYNSFIRTRQAASQSYEGYTIPIRQLRTRLFEAQRELKGVMARQGRLIETMAVNELDVRRKRLEEYQIKARFAMAESYDRATKAQLDAEILQQTQLSSEQPVVENDSAVEQESSSQASQQDSVVEEGIVQKRSSFKEKLLSR